jgi:hypothetical protein
MQPRVLRVPKHRGRPRKDAAKAEALSKRAQGMTPSEIAAELNPKNNESISADAYRKRSSFPKYPAASRILDLNVIRRGK